MNRSIILETPMDAIKILSPRKVLNFTLDCEINKYLEGIKEQLVLPTTETDDGEFVSIVRFKVKKLNVLWVRYTEEGYLKNSIVLQ